MEIKEFMDEMVNKYNKLSFIESDPISVPHRYSKREDIEISAFLTAIISWGQRKTIINNALRLMNLFDNQPFDFVVNHTEKDLKPLESFCHRTFNFVDLKGVLSALKCIYNHESGLENIFYKGYKKKKSVYDSLIHLYKRLEVFLADRSKKHIANVEKGASAKRLNMFLRWMVRNDEQGVDFGLWSSISPAHLFIPLDVHSGSVARNLELLKRKQNDWKSVDELTSVLRKFDPKDPVKYDYALFGVGVNGDI
ncbi:MAG: TIGR02757 family protein [Bacteroidales bacterium]|nr:TIGR02757 family protein [Bacteroidales bacterium]